MNRIRLLVSLLVLVGLPACGAKSPNEQLKTSLETIASWESTAHMVGEGWVRGDVPSEYVKQTLLTARQQLQTELDTLAHAPLPDEQRNKVLEQVQHPERTVDQMFGAVQQGDRASMMQQIDQISKDEQALEELTRSLGFEQ